MAPLPKRRHSTMRQGKRRSAINFPVPTTVTCPNCSRRILPHIVCPHCGYYGKKAVLAIKMPKSKTTKTHEVRK